MKISEVNYWKWRHKIEEMHHAQTKIKVSTGQYSQMEKDLEIMRLKTQIFKQVIKNNEDSYNSFKKEYEDIKLMLETEIGQSLDGCSINDVTYEVIKLENDELK